MRALAAAALIALAGCVGLPARGGFVCIGVCYTRLDHAADATGLRAVSAGVAVGRCAGGLTIGLQSTFCAILPARGDVAIIEQGSTPRAHLDVHKETAP